MTYCNQNLIASISLLCAFLTLSIAPPARAQTPVAAPHAVATPQAFEVASIRAVGPDHGFTVFPKFPAAQFSGENMSLTLLISLAYGFSDNRITSKPDWLDSTFFTIKAKPEGDVALTAEQYKPLLQQLLQQRFKLAVHHETRDLPGYALIVAKGGPKLKSADEKDIDAMAYINEDGLRCPSVTTNALAGLLTRPVGHPVIDKTGIGGHYNLDLRFASPASTDSPFPSIFTALQEQLGLKLEPAKVPTEFLAIDHIEKIPTEN